MLDYAPLMTVSTSEIHRGAWKAYKAPALIKLKAKANPLPTAQAQAVQQRGGAKRANWMARRQLDSLPSKNTYATYVTYATYAFCATYPPSLGTRDCAISVRLTGSLNVGVHLYPRRTIHSFTFRLFKSEYSIKNDRHVLRGLQTLQLTDDSKDLRGVDSRTSLMSSMSDDQGGSFVIVRFLLLHSPRRKLRNWRLVDRSIGKIPLGIGSALLLVQSHYHNVVDESTRVVRHICSPCACLFSIE